mgnify:CR=1 FL=1
MRAAAVAAVCVPDLSFKLYDDDAQSQLRVWRGVLPAPSYHICCIVAKDALGAAASQWVRGAAAQALYVLAAPASQLNKASQSSRLCTIVLVVCLVAVLIERTKELSVCASSRCTAICRARGA